MIVTLETNQSRPVSPEELEMQPKQNIANLIGGRERDWDFAALISIVKFHFRIEEGIFSGNRSQILAMCLEKKRINHILWKTASSSVSGKQTHLPSNRSLNNQDLRELLEYASIVAWYREILIICPQQEPGLCATGAGPRSRGARSCHDDRRLLPPPRLPVRLPGKRRSLQVGGGLRHRSPAVRHAGHRQGWTAPLDGDQGAGCTEWLKDPGPRNEKRTLFCDMVCFLFITPLAAISGWLCLRGAQDHLQFNSRLEAIGLIALTIALFTIYVLWTLVSFRYHCQLYSEWRRTNQKVRLMIPASRSPHPVSHSLLSAKLMKKTADETTV
ncbi:E3 ubiquitin-protein ligase MARCHF2 isoform 2-T3 [Morus bassanus]